jgi:hypothetical protein
VARVKGLHYGGGAEGTMEGSHKKKVGEVRPVGYWDVHPSE